MKWLAIFSLLLFTSLAQAGEKKLTVVTDLWPPYVTLKDEKLSGPSTDIVERILKQAGLEYDILLLPWARAYDMAQEQKNVLIYNLVRTADRENQFKWIGELHPSDPTHIFGIGVSREDPKSIEEALRTTISATRGSMSAEALQSKGFIAGKNLILTEDDEDAIRLAEMGRTDFVATSQNTIDAYVTQRPYLSGTVNRGINLLESRLFLAANKNTDSDLIDSLRLAFEVVMEESPTN